MSAATDKLVNSSLATFKNGDPINKKRGVTFGIPSADSIPYQAVAQKQNKNKVQTCLPINFFHTPGQYNKMLIQLSTNEKLNNFDRQIGILKSLQYINEPIFEKAKQKRDERIKDYENKRRQERSIKTDSRISKCICCCCDDFCQDCAAKTLCEKQESVEQSIAIEKSNRKWLIDIQAMKRGQYTKKKSAKLVSDNSQIQKKQRKKQFSHFRIQELISKTLIQAIEQKRDKKLENLIKKEQKDALKSYNEIVRANNRCHSAERSKSKIQIKPTKSQIRQAYWQSIKDLIKYELKNPHHKGKILQKSPRKQPECHRRSPEKIDHFKSLKRQKERGQSAEREIKKMKQEKAQKVQNKLKKLLALDYKQKEIIKKCHSKKFRPNQKMIETAFAHFI